MRAEDGRAQSLPALLPRTSPATPPPWRPGTWESRGTGEVRGRDCFPEGESFRPIAFPPRAKGRAGEGAGGCVCVRERGRRREARGKVLTRRSKQTNQIWSKAGNCCKTASILAVGGAERAPRLRRGPRATAGAGQGCGTSALPR